MQVTFWGVRGTFPVSGPDFVRYGGETMCVSVESGDGQVILDAGTGLRALGDRIAAAATSPRVDLFLSHGHLDHVMGLSQFAPLWRRDASIVIWTPDFDGGGAERAARSILRPPLMPPDAADLPAMLEWRTVSAGKTIETSQGVCVTPFSVRHPGGAAGFRTCIGQHSVAYVTDHEHGEPAADAALVSAVRNADILIYDATFTEAEMARRRGWGHSSWEAGVRLRDDAGAGLVAFAHHEPNRTDIELDTMAFEATQAASDAAFVKCGLILNA